MGKKASKFSMCGCDGDTFRPELESRLTDRSIPNTDPMPVPPEQLIPTRTKKTFQPLREFDGAELIPDHQPSKVPPAVQRHMSPIMMPHLRLPFMVYSTKSGQDSSASSDHEMHVNPSMLAVNSNSPGPPGVPLCTAKTIKESYIPGHTSETSDYLYD